MDGIRLQQVPDLNRLPRGRLNSMARAGREVRECMRVLHKTGDNLVAQILNGHETFYEWSHYPEGDVFDRETHSQYYYHAHRAGGAEHGHFHTFLRREGMPPGLMPLPGQPADCEPLSHLVAIGMDAYGLPVRLFTTNRWVTGETWYPAEAVVEMLDCFVIDQAWPSWPLNRWLGAMVQLFHPQIAALVRQRDRAIMEWRTLGPPGDVFEDRDLEVTAWIEISLDDQIEQINSALG